MRAGDQQVHVALESQMLEPIVEHVNGRAERGLGDAASLMAIRRNHHRDAGQRLREHQRFVAGMLERSKHGRAVGDDRDAGRG